MTLLNPSPIRELPHHVVDQIKAGEVVERPANVIKELLENALDAGSTQIDISIANVGMGTISIQDNGHGIPFEDLPLAFRRHTTSKISSFTDLYHLSSFGFRGEALASIASIAKVSCTSFLPTGEGGELRLEAGEVISHHRFQEKKNQGTLFHISDLFYNTPVRLKFLQSQTSEKNWIKKFLYSFILSHPECSFSVRWDQDDKLFYPATGSDVAARIKQLFSINAQDITVAHVEQDYQGIKIEVYLAKTSHRPHLGFHYFLVNDRLILDRVPHKIIQDTLLKNHWDDAYYIIKLQVVSDEIDVNVHPNKTTVKFHRSSDVFSVLSGVLQSCFPSRPKEDQLSGSVVQPTHIDGEIISEQMLEREQTYLNRFEQDSIHSRTGQLLFVFESGDFLYQIQNKLCFIRFTQLVQSFLKMKLKDLSPSIPLLVAYPFKEFKHQNTLEKNGFEFESVDKDYYLIRAIPDYLNGLPLKEALSYLFSELNQTTPVTTFSPKQCSQGKLEEILAIQDLSLWEKQQILQWVDSSLFGQ